MREQLLPWNHPDRKVLQFEELDIYVKLHAENISESDAVQMVTALMERYYGQKL